MQYAHPLYRITEYYPATKKMFLDAPGTQNNDPVTGDLLVFSTWFTPDTPIPQEDKDRNGWGDETTLADFIPEYIPTPEEVMRALRGPMGPAGPMGPQGSPA